VDARWSSGVMVVTFSDTVTYPVGRHIYILKGRAPSGATQNARITVSTNPSSDWTNIMDQITGMAVSLSGVPTVTMNTAIVQGGALGVTMGTAPAAQSIAPGTVGFVFANLILDASQSAEDVRLVSVPLYVSGNAEDLNTCQFYDGTTILNTGSRIANSLVGGASKNVFSFDDPITVSKGTTKTLALTCNISSTATSSSYIYFNTDANTNDYSIVGVSSGTTITPLVNVSSSNIITVQTAF
jgi:hypothetical protein